MRYSDGRVIKIGDLVCIRGRQLGVVGCIIDSGEFCDEFPKGAFGYLEKGMILRLCSGEVIYLEDYLDAILLISRDRNDNTDAENEIIEASFEGTRANAGRCIFTYSIENVRDGEYPSEEMVDVWGRTDIPGKQPESSEENEIVIIDEDGAKEYSGEVFPESIRDILEEVIEDKIAVSFIETITEEAGCSVFGEAAPGSNISTDRENSGNAVSDEDKDENGTENEAEDGRGKTGLENLVLRLIEKKAEQVGG